MTTPLPPRLQATIRKRLGLPELQAGRLPDRDRGEAGAHYEILVLPLPAKKPIQLSDRPCGNVYERLG